MGCGILFPRDYSSEFDSEGSAHDLSYDPHDVCPARPFVPERDFIPEVDINLEDEPYDYLDEGRSKVND